MAALFTDGDTRLPIRTKINGVAAALQITYTRGVISAGEVTSILITAVTTDLLNIGDKVYLIDANTGETHLLTLAADLIASDETITIEEYTFSSDVPVTSIIIPDIRSLCNKTFVGS